MPQILYFDAVEKFRSNGWPDGYTLYAVGDDGFLYVAECAMSGVEPDEEVLFNKVIHQKIDLDLKLAISGSMLAHTHDLVYVAVKDSQGKPKLYTFKKNNDAWSLTIRDIPSNTTSCIAVFVSYIFLGGIGGLTRISDSEEPIIISSAKVGTVNSISIARLIVFAGTEHGLLMSADLFVTYKIFSPENTHNALLPNGVGKIITANLDSKNLYICAFLMQNSGISRLVITGKDEELYTTWGKPFDISDMPDYQYSSEITYKDLATGDFDIPLSDPIADAIPVELYTVTNSGKVLWYDTSSSMDFYVISLRQELLNPYYNSTFIDQKTTPIIKYLPGNLRILVLSDEKVLAMTGSFGNENVYKWVQINLPD